MDNNLGGWLATAQYVVPIEDLKYHDAGSKSCWCHPILNSRYERVSGMQRSCSASLLARVTTLALSPIKYQAID